MLRLCELPGYSGQVPPTHQADLSHQLGQLSLQDPAFLQELQRLENQKYQYGGLQPLPAQHEPGTTGMFPAQVANMPTMVPMGPNSLPSVPMGGPSTGGPETLRDTMTDKSLTLQDQAASLLSAPRSRPPAPPVRRPRLGATTRWRSWLRRKSAGSTSRSRRRAG